MMKFKNRFAASAVLIILILGVSFMAGCIGSSEDTTTPATSSSQKLLQIEGGLPAELSSSPMLGAPKYATDYSNGKYSVAAVNKDNYSEEIGTVTITDTTYTASLAITTVSKYAVLIIRDKVSNKILYQNLLGKTPVLNDMPAGVNSFKVTGISINSETTARTLLAIEKNVVPDLPIVTTSELSSGVTKDVTGQKSQFDTAVEVAVGGADVVTNVKNAIQTVNSILTSTLSQSVKDSLVSATAATSVTQMLKDFVNIVSTTDTSVKSVITSNNLVTSVTVGTTDINSQTNTNTLNTVVTTIVTPPADTTSPMMLSVSISPASVKSGETVTITFTASETLYAAPAVSIMGRSASVSKITGNTYSAAIQISQSDLGAVTFSINSYSDLSGNVGAAVNSTTDGTGASITPTGAVSAPEFNQLSGIYTSTQSVTITSATADAIIRYTTDGSTPSATVGTIYSSAISVSATTTIKAIATKTGLTDSTVSSATYTITINPAQVAAPEFNPLAGTYTSTQSVTLTSSTADAVIRYTTDGSTPSATVGTVYSSAISVSATTTIKAIATKTAMTDSAVSSAMYVINISATQVAAPEFNPLSGTYTTTQSVVLTSATPEAVIRYTTDGSTPSATVGTVYSSAISVSATTTINAIATKTAMTDSAVTTATYTINISATQVAAAEFNPVAGTYTTTQSVTLTSSTANAIIRYTTDGSTPSATVGTVYSSAISLSATTTIKAIATVASLTDGTVSNSAVSSALYTINIPLLQVAAPESSPVAGTYTSTQSVALTSATSGAVIRYTTDGSTPSAIIGTIYSSTISVTLTTTIKAIATKTGMTDSAVSSALYTINVPLQVETPVLTPSATNYTNKTVTITCATTDAVILYTTNGSDPTAAAGTVYSAPFTVNSTRTVKAIATKTGMTDSAIASATYTILYLPPAITDVTSPAFTTAIGNNTITITLTGGTFKSGAIVASDFTFAGTDKLVLAAATTFTRTSDTVVTVTGMGALAGGADNTIIVKAATQATQASSVAAVASSALSNGLYTFAAAAAANSVVYTNTGGAEKLSFYVTGLETSPATMSAIGNADLKALSAALIAGDKITLASSAITKVELIRSGAGALAVPFGALAYAVDVTGHATNLTTVTGTALTTVNVIGGTVSVSGVTATIINVTAPAAATVAAGAKAVTVPSLVTASTISTTGALTIGGDLTTKLTLGAAPSGITANGTATIDPVANNVTVTSVTALKTLTLDDSNATGTLTITAAAGTVKLATTAPSGITVNGDANVDMNGIAATITDVLATKILTVTSSSGTPALTVTAAAGTIKMGTASIPVTVNGNAALDMNGIAATITDVLATKILTVTSSSGTPALTVTAAAGTIKMGTASIPVTANGDANIDSNGVIPVISNVANTKTLTLSNTGAATTLSMAAASGGTVKIAATAPTAITATASGILDINNINTTITNITGTLTLTNSGNGSAGDVTVTNGGVIAGTLATTAAVKVFKSITISSGTTLTALNVGATGTVNTLTNNGVITTLTAAGKIMTFNVAGTVTDSTIAFNAATAQTVAVTAGGSLNKGSGTGITVSDVTQSHTITVANTGIIGAAYPLVLGVGSGKTITGGTVSAITLAGLTPNATIAGTCDNAAGAKVTVAAVTGNATIGTSDSLPAGTYTKKTSSSNALNEAYLSGMTLSVGTGTTTNTYDLTNNATVTSIMTNIAANDTFTIDGASKVSDIVASVAGNKSVAITASQCAASVNVTGPAATTLTLTGSAATQGTNFAVLGGLVDLSNTNLTGTVSASTANSTITAGTKAISTTGAFTFTVTGTGLVTIGNGGTVVISGVTVPGTASATVQQTGTSLTIAGTTVGTVLVNSASTITDIVLDATTTGALTNSKALLASLTVNASKTLTLLTVDAATTITTLTNNGTITTLTDNGTITTLGGTGTYATLTIGAAGTIFTALTNTMTITNITATASSRSIDLGTHAKAINVTGPANGSGFTLTLTSGAGAATINVKGGVVDLSGTLTDDVLNIAATFNTTVTAGTKDVTIASLVAGTNTLTTTGALTLGTTADIVGPITLGAVPSGITSAWNATVNPVANNITVAAVTGGKTLTLDDTNAAGTLTITAAAGTVKLATNAPTGAITVNGTANLDMNNLASTIADVTAGVLTVTSTGGVTGALTITASTGTIKMGTASIPVIVNGAATVDANALATAITNVTDATLTLNNATSTLAIAATTGTGNITLGNASSGITASGNASIGGTIAMTISDVTAGTLKIVDIAGTAPTNVTVTTTAGGAKVAIIDAITGNLIVNGGTVDIGDGVTAGSVGGTTTLATSANVTVTSTGTITGTVSIPAAYAGTWSSVQSSNIGAVTIGGNVASGASITFKGVVAAAFAPTFTITGATGPSTTTIAGGTAGYINVDGAGLVAIQAATLTAVNASDETIPLAGALNTKVKVTNNQGTGAITQIQVLSVL